jgi:hypothetical protein
MQNTGDPLALKTRSDDWLLPLLISTNAVPVTTPALWSFLLIEGYAFAYHLAPFCAFALAIVFLQRSACRVKLSLRAYSSPGAAQPTLGH